MTAAIIFGLLIALMLTGMPISISLGLTVLTFLFTMTQVPIESVALKLFTGIEKFEIMAIPFFILAGNFLTHGGVARRMIAFASACVGHLHGGLGIAGVMAALAAAPEGGVLFHCHTGKDRTGMIAGDDGGNEFIETGARRHGASSNQIEDQMPGPGISLTACNFARRLANDANDRTARPSSTGGNTTMFTIDQP